MMVTSFQELSDKSLLFSTNPKHWPISIKDLVAFTSRMCVRMKLIHELKKNKRICCLYTLMEVGQRYKDKTQTLCLVCINNTHFHFPNPSVAQKLVIANFHFSNLVQLQPLNILQRSSGFYSVFPWIFLSNKKSFNKSQTL